MSTTTLDVADLISVLDFAGVQKRLAALPGVSAVEMTAASSSVTLTYDPARTDAAAIAAEINACGFNCRGETVPKHLCLPDRTAVPPDTPKAPSAAVPTKDVHAGHTGMTPAAMAAMDESPADKKSGMAKDAMAREMGHGSGRDMQGMVRDMRNRFIICLVFTLPIFALAPMGIGAPLFGPRSA